METAYSIGIIGLGNISAAYRQVLEHSPAVRIVAVADIDDQRARRVAAEIPGARALSPQELLAAPDVDTVLNLTTPGAHANIAVAALRNGKRVYGEKPLATSAPEGREVVNVSRSTGISAGSAPDTVLGTGVQTARAAIESGLIGRPIAASATMVTPGHERWHPAPDFYYQAGGGPLMDMGPYYVTALVHLLGPVRRVIGMTSRTRDRRVIGSGPRQGETIPVDVASHVTGVLEHANGALSTLLMSFDSAATFASPIEVHGDAGTLAVPDPNSFDGPVLVRGVNDVDWHPVQPCAGYESGARGVGLIEFMTRAAGVPGRANAEIAQHVLEAFEAVFSSSRTGQRVDVDGSCSIPELVPLTARQDWIAGRL